MKKLLFTLLVGITSLAYSQAPQQISYQGVARNASGTVLANQPIGIKFDIHQGSASGPVVFTETHTGVSTNGFGLFTTYIGSISNLAVISWSTNSYFIEVSIDPNTGTYSSLGSQQLMSVPYALNAGSAPAPAVSFTNNILSVGGNTISITSGTTYTAGTGISISGGVISNTLAPITPTITSGNNITINPTSPSNSYTVSAPSYSLSQSGNNIDLLQNGTSISSVTLSAANPTTTVINGNNITLNQSGSTYTVNAPTYSLSQSGNNIDLLQNGTSIGTATLPVVTSYSAGNGIDITGGVISNTLIPTTQTLSISGNSISINPGNTQALPNYSLTQLGANIDLTQNGTSIATVTLTAATSTSLSAGSSNILLNQSGNAYTITPVTPTFTNSGPTTITGSYPNYTVNSVASPTTSVVSTNTNISVSNAAGIYSLTAITPTLSGSGVIGAYPSYTINSTPNQTLSVNSGSLSISGGNTVPIPTTSVVSTNTNISVTSSAGVFSLTAVSSNLSGDVIGTVNSTTVNAIKGVNVSNTAPTNGQILQLVGGIWTPTTTIVPILSYTGSATAGTLQSGAQTVTIPNYTLSNTSNTITINNGTANSTAIIPVPTLTLSGTTLTSGPATNSVNLSSINNWSVTTGVIYPSTLTNSVGVGINNSLGGRLGVSHTSSPASPHINLISPTTSDFGRVKFSNTGSSSYFSFEARNNTGGVADAFNIAHNNGTDEKQVFLINGNRNVFINNLNLPLAAFHVMTHSTTPNGLAVEGFNKSGELIISRNNQTGLSGSRQPIVANNEIGRITFSGASSTVYPNEYIGGSSNIFVKATDNFGPSTRGSEMYFQTVPTGTNVSKDVMKLTQDGTVEITNMLRIPYGVLASGKVLTSDAAGNASWQTITAPASPWIQGIGIVTQGTFNDKVGIGTNTPSSLLHIVSSVPSPSQLILGNVNQPSTEWEWRVDALSNLSLINEGSGSPFTSMFAENTTGNIGIGTTSPSSKLNAVSSGTTTSAGRFDITNSSNSSVGLLSTSNGSGMAIEGLNTGTGMAGYFFVQNASSSATGVQVTTTGTGNAINANANTGSAINAVATGASATELIFNNGSGDGLQIFTGLGRGINATNTSNIVSAAQFYNDGTSNSLLATKNPTTTGGNVARFENNSTSNSADAMYVSNSGGGAAIHAVTGATVSGGTNTALWLEAGHLKATGTTVTTGSLNVSGGFTVPSFAPILTNCNDVKGTFSFTTSVTGIVAGAFIELEIKFSKPYITAPTVIATPVSDLQGLSYMVINTTTSSFFVRVYRTTNTNVTTPLTIVSGSTFKFNYMVIE
jgi:hypothetical protein